MFCSPCKKKCITLTILGLDGAGKTSLLKRVMQDESDPLPTMGFQPSKYRFGMTHGRQIDCRFFDVGGAAKIRGIWRNYVAEAHGIVFVLRNMDRLEESMFALKFLDTLQFNVKKKPILLLINANQGDEDRWNAVDWSQWFPTPPTPISTITDQSPMDTVFIAHAQCKGQFLNHTSKRTGRMGSRVAPSTTGIDPRIGNAINHFLHHISINWSTLERRVQFDTAQQQEQYRQERQEKLARLQVDRPIAIKASK